MGIVYYVSGLEKVLIRCYKLEIDFSSHGKGVKSL